MVPLKRPTVIRIVAGLVLAALVVADIVFRADISAFIGKYHLAAVVLCAVVAFGLALIICSMISGDVSLKDTHLKWIALLFFAVLLLHFSLVPAFQLKPGILLFIAIVVCIVGLCRAKTGKDDDEETIRKRELSLTMGVLTIAMILGLYLVLAATGYAKQQDPSGVERTAMGWGLAYFGALFIVGFLFAYPRTLEVDSESKPSYQQRVNTNLEQISDWLTKIIVGLGLVELKQIPPKLAQASAWMAQSFTNASPPPPELSSFCTGFIIYFGVLGFLAGHLSTRMFLSPAFYRGDQRRVEVKVAVERKTATEDTDTTKFLAFVQDKANSDKVDAWLTLKGKPSLKASDIAVGADYAGLRKQALDELAKS